MGGDGDDDGGVGESDEDDEMMDINLSGTGTITKDMTDQKLDAWAAVLSQWDETPRAKIRSLTRKGIPDALRDQVWRRLVSTGLADNDLIQNFPRLVQKESANEQVIMWDLTRTFPGNKFFAEAGGVGQTRLYNICKAYSVYDEEVGYCQGLSFVAAELILHMPEEDAFCLFIKIMYDYKVRDMFKKGFANMQLKYFQLTKMVEKHIPDLFAHFRELGVEVHMFCTQWFLTVYATKFPLCTAYQILDVFLSEGPLVLFNIALGLLKLGKRYLLQYDFEGVMNFFRVDLPRMFPDDRSALKLISVSMKCKVTEKDLDKFEADYLIMKAEEEMANDPLQRSEEENKALKADVQRLEGENESLAHVMVSGQVEMQQKISELDLQKNSLTRELAKLRIMMASGSKESAEVKSRLEEEAAQVKTMYRESDRGRDELMQRLEAAEEQLEAAQTQNLQLKAKAALSDHPMDVVELQGKLLLVEQQLAQATEKGALKDRKVKAMRQELQAANIDLQTLKTKGSGGGFSKFFKR
jgi:hypothetical protein